MKIFGVILLRTILATTMLDLLTKTTEASMSKFNAIFLVGKTGCVRTCANALRTSFVLILGNSQNIDVQLLAPFHTIITKSQSNLIAQRKVEWICHAIKKFDRCALKCPDSKAKLLRMANVYQWNSLCQASSSSPTAFIEFLRCEKNHFQKSQKICQVPPSKDLARLLPTQTAIMFEVTNAALQQHHGNYKKQHNDEWTSTHVSQQPLLSLKQFCRIFESYSKCYSNVPFKCSSANATEIWSHINNSVMRSYNLLTEISSQHMKMPAECKVLMSLYSRTEEKENKYLTLSTTLSLLSNEKAKQESLSHQNSLSNKLKAEHDSNNEAFRDQEKREETKTTLTTLNIITKNLQEDNNNWMKINRSEDDDDGKDDSDHLLLIDDEESSGQEKSGLIETKTTIQMKYLMSEKNFSVSAYCQCFQKLALLGVAILKMFASKLFVVTSGNRLNVLI